MGDTVLRLVPSNWFYNLSVYGFLRVLSKECTVNLKEVFKEDGSVEIDLEEHGLLEETEEIAPGVRSVKLWDCLVEAYLITFKDYEEIKDKPFEEKHKKVRGRLFSKSGQFTNYINPSYFKENVESLLFKTLGEFLKWANNKEKIPCQFCGDYPLLLEFLKENAIPNKTLQKVFRNLQFLKMEQLSLLGPSLGEFPNSFWNLNSSVPLCLVCNILFLFYPLGLTDIGGGRRIFVNAPSFELIWKLNNHIEKVHSKEAYKNIKTLFGLGFIDLVLDLNVKLGTWQRLSTEVIVFQGQNVDFYEIPPQILELLEDKRVSSLLVELSNLKLLEVFMSGNFKLFEVLIHRLLRNAESNKDDELLKEFGLTYSPYKVKTLSKLYALIVSKLKKPAEVGV